MPINILKCNYCDFSKEYITTSVKEEIPPIRCKKCGNILVRGVGTFRHRFTLQEGFWEKGEDGQEKYRGKGGKKVPVHRDGTPI